MKKFLYTVTALPIYFLGFTPWGLGVWHHLDAWHTKLGHDSKPCDSLGCDYCKKNNE